MKRKILWWGLMVVGVVPFAAPFLCFIYEMMVGSSFTLADWLVLYSFIYWPSYLVGLVLIILSVIMLKFLSKKAEQ